MDNDKGVEVNFNPKISPSDENNYEDDFEDDDDNKNNTANAWADDFWGKPEKEESFNEKPKR